MCDNPSVVGRMGNLMMNAMNSSVIGKKVLPLPKLIIIVADDDIIKCLRDTKDGGLTNAFGRLINYIMTEYDRAIATYKEHLPTKCKRDGYPHMLWIQAPSHINYVNESDRYKFNKGLEEMVKYHSNAYTLPLKKGWCPNNEDLFSSSLKKYTAEGYAKYWEAVECTVRYFDSIMLKKHDKKINKKIKTSNNCQNDKFKWINPNIKKDVAKFAERKLPSPPPMKHRY